MKFRDKVERDPETYGYLVLTQEQVLDISSKQRENKAYKQSFEKVQEFINQKPITYIYKVKLRDLDVGEGFYSEGINYVCKRIE